MCCLIVMGPSQHVYAQENTELPSLIIEETGSGETVGNQYDSVLQIVVSCTDKKGNVVPIQGGSGFLIGDDETQLQYMITTNEVAVVSDKLKEKLRKRLKFEKVEDVKEELNVVINKDVTIAASVITNSEEMDFAILQLSQPLHDRSVLLLNDKEAEQFLEKSATVLGYPSATRNDQEMIYYTGIDLQKTEGFLETEEIMNGQKYIRHHIFPNYGNLGGPILDEDNNIVALNQAKNDGKNFYALEITEIMHVMDSLGIPYTTVSQVEEEKEAELAAVVHKDALNSVIAKSENLNLDEYKKKTITGFNDCLEAVKVIQEDINATQDDVDKATKKMQEAIDILEPKMPLKMVVTIIAGCCLLVVIMLLIILKVTSKARKARKERKKEEFTVTEPAPVFQKESPMLKTSYKDLVQAGNREVSNQNIWNMPASGEDDYEQTSILGNSSYQNPTSVLMQQSVTLIRCGNNENVLINYFPFVIGKDQSKTDYCVHDNSAVSRVHATLIQENSTIFIQDSHATNGTFVNGKRLPAGGRVALQNNDRIRLGNEEFDFKTTI